MTRLEVRMRTIEALASMGIREPQRLIRDAAVIDEWVWSVSDDAENATAPARRGRPPKAEDKA